MTTLNSFILTHWCLWSTNQPESQRQQQQLLIIYLQNNDNIIKSSILVTDISDHFPTTLSTNIDLANSNTSGNGKRVTYKRNHSDDNITKLKHKLSEVKWCEILDGNDADVDYNKFLETFDNTMIVFHWKNVMEIEKRNLLLLGLQKVFLLGFQKVYWKV